MLATLRLLYGHLRRTYRIKVRKGDLEAAAGKVSVFGTSLSPQGVTYFVNLLRGPNNESDFTYMGVVRKPGKFFWTSASGRVGREAPSYRALLWMLDAMVCQREGVLGKLLEVWHEGKCGRCGRKLTVPESIQNGLGPDCAERIA